MNIEGDGHALTATKVGTGKNRRSQEESDSDGVIYFEYIGSNVYLRS